jgi:tartronate-semialdehyde synthase
MDYQVQLSFENVNAPELGVYGVDHVAVARGLGCKAIRVTDPTDAQQAFATARELMKEYQVPVVVEFILERVTNIAMGTEIDNIVEFEEVLDLPLDDEPASPTAARRGLQEEQKRFLGRNRIKGPISAQWVSRLAV